MDNIQTLIPFPKNISLIFTAFLIILLVSIAIILVVYIIIKRKEKVAYDILVEVIPEWANIEKIINENKVNSEELEKIKASTPFGVEYYQGGLIFDDSKGLYFLIIKAKKKIKVAIDNPYIYLRPVEKWLNKANIKRVITLYRKSPHDFKPIKVKVSGAEEVKNIIDTESLATHFITMEEIKKKFLKLEGLMKYKEFIMLGIFILVMMIMLGVIIYFTNSIKEGLKEVSSALIETAKALKTSTP